MCDLFIKNSMKFTEEHTIDICANVAADDVKDDSEFLQEEDYTMSFRFTGKFFRKTVSDIKTMSKTMTFIQNAPEEPLLIKYDNENRKLKSVHRCVDGKKTINFKSKLEEDDSLRVDMKVEYIKPIAQAQQHATHVDIFVDENRKFMTRSIIEGGTFEIKTLTEIIDHRTKNTTPGTNPK